MWDRGGSECVRVLCGVSQWRGRVVLCGSGVCAGGVVECELVLWR